MFNKLKETFGVSTDNGDGTGNYDPSIDPEKLIAEIEKGAKGNNVQHVSTTYADGAGYEIEVPRQ